MLAPYHMCHSESISSSQDGQLPIFPRVCAGPAGGGLSGGVIRAAGQKEEVPAFELVTIDREGWGFHTHSFVRGGTVAPIRAARISD